MKQMYRNIMVMSILIHACLPLYGMDVDQKRRALEEQIRNLTESAKKVVGPIVERVQAEIAQLKNQIARLPAEQRPARVVMLPPTAPTPRPTQVLRTPSPEIAPAPTVSVQPTTPISSPFSRPIPSATAPEGQSREERPLPPVPAPEGQAIERPLPPLPMPEPIILKKPLPERKPATQVTPAREIRPAEPQMPVEDLRPMTRPVERPLPAVPQTSPEGVLLEPLPAPSEEELSQMVAPVPPMDVPQTRVIEKSPTLLEEIQRGKPLRPVTPIERSPQPTQPTLLEEIQKGKQLRPITPTERREYRSDVYKLFEGEQAARGFEQARQQALERAQTQAAREEDWQGWE